MKTTWAKSLLFALVLTGMMAYEKDKDLNKLPPHTKWSYNHAETFSKRQVEKYCPS